MTYERVHPSTTIEVPNHKSLLAAWKEHGGPFSLVGRFIVKKPLTAAQLRRLPEDLRARLLIQ